MSDTTQRRAKRKAESDAPSVSGRTRSKHEDRGAAPDCGATKTKTKARDRGGLAPLRSRPDLSLIHI